MYECFCLRRCQDRPEHDDGAGPTDDGAGHGLDAAATDDAAAASATAATDDAAAASATAAAADAAADDVHEQDAGSPPSYVWHICESYV